MISEPGARPGAHGRILTSSVFSHLDGFEKLADLLLAQVDATQPFLSRHQGGNLIDTGFS